LGISSISNPREKIPGRTLVVFHKNFKSQAQTGGNRRILSQKNRTNSPENYWKSFPYAVSVTQETVDTTVENSQFYPVFCRVRNWKNARKSRSNKSFPHFQQSFPQGKNACDFRYDIQKGLHNYF